MSGGVCVDWPGLLADGIAAATGASPADCADYALVILERLQREAGGLEVYVPALRRPPVTVEEIDSDRAAHGIPLDSACRRAGVSRRTYYRMKERQREEGRAP